VTQPIRVFLADDQHLVRAGFRMVLDSQADIEVVGEAADGADAVRQLARLAAGAESGVGPGGVEPADVVLMDVRMPVMDGIEATARLQAVPDGPRVLVLTTFDLDEYAFAAIRAGASGFLLKDAPPEDLLSAVRTVHAGDGVVAPSTTRRLLSHLATLPDTPLAATAADPRLAALTDREHQVLVKMGEGLTNAEIAGALFLSETTVKTHIGRVFAKLGLRDRVQAVILAYETGLVRP